MLFFFFVQVLIVSNVEYFPVVTGHEP